jgi:hypothetical protein
MFFLLPRASSPPREIAENKPNEKETGGTRSHPSPHVFGFRRFFFVW